MAKDGVARSKVLDFVEIGSLITVSLGAELPAIRELLDRYADTPMDFADACVVRLSELQRNSEICTIDSHFQFFRKNGRDVIPLIFPSAF